MSYKEEYKNTVLKHYFNTPHTMERTAYIFGVGERTLKYWVAESGKHKAEPKYYMNLNNYHSHVWQCVIDIECLPSLGAFYNRAQGWISPKQIIQHGFMCSFQYNINGGEVINVNLRDMGLFPETGMLQPKHAKELVEVMSRLVSEVHMVIGHNAKKFDISKLYTYMMKHGVKPTRRPPVYDTMIAAKRIGKFESNSLDDIAHYFGIRRKIAGGMGFDIGIPALCRDEASWDHIISYGDNDVVMTEEVYLMMRPYSVGNLHPNMAMWFSDNKPRCVVCGHDKLKWVNDLSTKQTQAYNVVKCTMPKCGHVMEEKTTALSKEKRGSVLKSCT